MFFTEITKLSRRRFRNVIPVYEPEHANKNILSKSSNRPLSFYHISSKK